uniref:Uncharacterized protein n=1 Tax=Astyanax mexicanus TaxID=7994 RepID=A0A8B9KVM0_ASTMX
VQKSVILSGGKTRLACTDLATDSLKSHSLSLHKRNWVWNQFFVLEEYTGDEPLYVGKVRNRSLVFLVFETGHCQPFNNRGRKRTPVTPQISANA